ncbi:hypothetical protein IAT40_000198 [Kwoniella sp. CBS 6097]
MPPTLSRGSDSSSAESNIVTPPFSAPELTGPPVIAPSKSSHPQSSQDLATLLSKYGLFPKVGEAKSEFPAFVSHFKQLRITGNLCNLLRRCAGATASQVIMKPISSTLSPIDNEDHGYPIVAQLGERIHIGHLWTVYRAKLAPDLPGYGDTVNSVSVVLKVLSTTGCYLAEEQRLQYEEDEVLTPETAYDEATNEDAILRRLIKHQGHFVPSYYGLYYSPDSNREGVGGLQELGKFVMVMEDVGEQRWPAYARHASVDFTLKERMDGLELSSASSPIAETDKAELPVQSDHPEQGTKRKADSTPDAADGPKPDPHSDRSSVELESTDVPMSRPEDASVSASRPEAGFVAAAAPKTVPTATARSQEKRRDQSAIQAPRRNPPRAAKMPKTEEPLLPRKGSKARASKEGLKNEQKG